MPVSVNGANPRIPGCIASLPSAAARTGRGWFPLRPDTWDSILPKLCSFGLPNLYISEDVRLAIRRTSAVAAVRPNRVDHCIRSREPIVVTNEAAAAEETLIWVPRSGADVEVRPGGSVVGRERLKGFNQLIARIIAVVIPDDVQVSTLVNRNPGKELVIGSRVTIPGCRDRFGAGPSCSVRERRRCLKDMKKRNNLSNWRCKLF